MKKELKVKISASERFGSVCIHAALALIIVVCLYPVWYVLAASLSESDQLMRHSGVLFLPKGFSIAAYKKVFANPSIATGYQNTLFILIVGTALQMLMTCIGAYFLSRRNVIFQKPVMILILFTMFFQGGMIPTYLNLKSLNLTGSHWGLILPVMINTQNLIILKTAFSGIPSSLIEAAEMDGASHYKILFRIVLPLSKAMLSVIVLYYGVATWNSWFWASAILRDRAMYPLQVILREILLSNSISGMTADAGVGDVESIAMSIKYATIIVATIPILCVYPFLQKYFASGMMTGAVKE